MKEHCMRCNWFLHGHGDCRIWGVIPKFVCQEGACSYYSESSDSESPDRHEIIKTLVQQMKKISDKSLEILAEIAAERMEK